jgi:hypothetical protein
VNSVQRLTTLVAIGFLALARPGVAQVAGTDSLPRIDSTNAVRPLRAIPDIGANQTGLSSAVQDTVRRPRAIEYSDAYNVRLTIHRWGSYIELPLFAAELIVGQKLLTEQQTSNVRHSSLRSAHGAIASGLGALFAVNTVTGLWNLYDSRHDPAGRTRRIIHSIGMLVADAGFAYTASVAGDARETSNGVSTHRSAAYASVGVATAATLMMWLWKN